MTEFSSLNVVYRGETSFDAEVFLRKWIKVDSKGYKVVSSGLRWGPHHGGSELTE